MKELQQYIENAKKAGYSIREIRGRLMSAGWHPKDVYSILPIKKSVNYMPILAVIAALLVIFFIGPWITGVSFSIMPIENITPAINETMNESEIINETPLESNVTEPVENEILNSEPMEIAERKLEVLGLGNWWNTSFDRCQNITITNGDSGSGDLIDFPVYINISYDSNMLSDYSNIRFVNASCNSSGSRLEYEIENYTSISVHTWVKIPKLTSGDTNISIYYKNNTAVTSKENKTGVWDDGYYLGVWHMNATDATDSTKYVNDGDDESSGVTQTSSGKICNANNFSGSDYINMSQPGSLKPIENVTVSAWVYVTSFGDATLEGVAGMWNPPANDRSYALYTNGGGQEYPTFAVSDDGTWNAGQRSAGQEVVTASTGTWYYFVGVYNGTNAHLYRDGDAFIDIVSETNAGINSGSTDFLVGAQSNSGPAYRFLNGIIDELRVSNITRSADWINMSYEIVQNQDSLVVFDREEARPGTPSPPVISNAEINESSYITENTFVNVSATVIDADGDLDSVTIEVIPPISSKYNATVKNSTADYFYNHTLNLTEPGQWRFRLYANDSTGDDATIVLAQAQDSNNYINVSYCNGGYNGTGDWNVSSNRDVTCSDITIQLDGNLTVLGSLTFYNVTLSIGSSSVGGFKINVSTDGIFNVQNNSNITTTTISNSVSFGFITEQNSTLIINNSYVKNYGYSCGNCWSPLQPECGLLIRTNNVTITNSRFTRAGVGIWITTDYQDEDKTILIENNTIEQTLCYGIVVNNNNTYAQATARTPLSNVTIANNTIEDVRRTLSSTGVFGLTNFGLGGNNGDQVPGTGIFTFSVNFPDPATGLHAFNFTGNIQNNLINNSYAMGVYIDGSSKFVLDNNTFEDLCNGGCTGGFDHMGIITLEEDGSSYTTIKNNIITKGCNSHGITLQERGANPGIGALKNVSIINNTIKNCAQHGLYFVEIIQNNTISGNNITNCSDSGIEMKRVGLDYPGNNTIYDNYFNNTNNANDTNGNNFWNITKTSGTNIIGGSWLGGNYWDDYTGSDTDGDGLGNTLTPYTSSNDIENGGDYLPLTDAATKDETQATDNVGAPNTIDEPMGFPNSISEGISVDKVSAGEPILFEIRDENIVITSISLTLKKDLEGVEVMATSLGSNPGITPPRKIVYKYLVISAPAITGSAIDSASISFAVDVNWIRDNKIIRGTIVLERYVDNKWVPLTTIMNSETENRLTFKSATPSFGYFVIRGDSELPVEELPEKIEEIPIQKDMDYFSMLLILIIIVLLSGYLIYRHKKKLEEEYQLQKPL